MVSQTSLTAQQCRWLMERLTVTPKNSVRTVKPPEYMGWLCAERGVLQSCRDRPHSRCPISTGLLWQTGFAITVKIWYNGTVRHGRALPWNLDIRRKSFLVWKKKQSSAEERRVLRQLGVRPLVEAYFTWVRENISKVPGKSKTHEVVIDTIAGAKSSAIIYSIA